MKTSSHLAFNATFVLVLALFAAQGALICFWPKTWKSLQSRFPRGYDPNSQAAACWSDTEPVRRPLETDLLGPLSWHWRLEDCCGLFITY